MKLGLEYKSRTKQVKWLGALLVVTMFLCLMPVAGAADGGLEEIGNYGFIPNSGEASVSKVDLKNYQEVARYYTAPRVGDMVNLVGETASTANTITPYSWRTSRIAMDAEGNAWVINTGADGTNLQGSIVRIQADTTGLFTNSDPAIPLTFGTDKAVQVFPVGVPGDMPRAIAIDSEGYIWVGFYSGGQLMKYEYDEAAETLTPVAGPFYPPLDAGNKNYIRYYEMKFAPDGTLFISSRSSTPARTPIQTGIWTFTTGSFVRESTWNSPYSILIADDGTVYATAYNNLLYIRTDPNAWTPVTITGSSENRGMGFDNAGNIWIASTVSTSGGTVVFQYNPETNVLGPNYALKTGTTPVGVGKDGAGNMWVVCRSDNMAQGWIEGFNPETVTKVGAIQVGYRPYAYGDFTQYKLQEIAALGDFVWEDMNANGIQEAGEPGIEGVTVNLYDCEDKFIAEATTDATGYYLFDGLMAGCYYVEFELPEGYEFSPQNVGDDALDSDAYPMTGITEDITLGPGVTDLTWDAGMYEFASLGDYVWNDFDHDGIQGEDEHGVTGVIVELYDCDGVLKGTTTTGATGYYLFDDLVPGSYYVKFVLPEGAYFSPANMGTDDALDSDADPTTGMTICTDLLSGETDLTWDAGMYRFMYETAYAMGDPAKCFIEGVDGVSFDNWGWTNPITTTGTYTWPLWAAAGQCDTSKGIEVGTVTVKYEDGTVTVTYNVDAPYISDETHVYAGNTAFPMKKGIPTVAPGAYYNNGGFTGTVYVIAHAVVGIPDPDFGLQA